MSRISAVVMAATVVCIGGQAPVQGQGGKPRKLAAVPLSVVIEPQVTPTTLNPGGAPSIAGDGPYENGQIDEYGNLIIAFERPIHFEYGERLLDPDSRSDFVTDEPVTGWHSGGYVSTLNRSGEPPLQELRRGKSQCIKLNWQYDHPAGGWWRHGYNRGSDHKENGTSYAVFTRVDTDAEVWTVEPLGGQACGFTNRESTAAVFTQQSVKGKWVVKDYGDYVLPFKLTLTRKP